MKIKKFNENKEELDPYGEENWNDESPSAPNVCKRCGGHHLEYGNLVSFNGLYPQVAYEYDCKDCDFAGYEVFDITFSHHEER